MKPYFQAENITLYHGDCLAVLPMLETGSVDLITVDPPYFRVKSDDWDRQWKSDGAFLEWIDTLCQQWQRVLKPNGSLYCFASPDKSFDVESVIRRRFRVLNNIRWEKEEGWHNKADEEALRSYLSNWEAIIFAEPIGASIDSKDANGYWDECRELHKQVYAPIGEFIQTRREAAGLQRREVDIACAPSRKPTRLCYRWEEGACLPTLLQFVDFMRLIGDCREYEALRREYEALRREYEALRREYEALRRPFNLNASSPRSDIWRYRTVKPSPDKHPCQKPLAMFEHIIEASSRYGDTVLDCCMGSGTAIKAAKNLGRKAIGIELSEYWCRQAVAKVQQTTLFEPQPSVGPYTEPARQAALLAV